MGNDCQPRGSGWEGNRRSDVTLVTWYVHHQAEWSHKADEPRIHSCRSEASFTLTWLTTARAFAPQNFASVTATIEGQQPASWGVCVMVWLAMQVCMMVFVWWLAMQVAVSRSRDSSQLAEMCVMAWYAGGCEQIEGRQVCVWWWWLAMQVAVSRSRDSSQLAEMCVMACCAGGCEQFGCCWWS